MILTSVLIAAIATLAAGYAWVLWGGDTDAAEMRRYEAEREAFRRLMK